jgi:uncharacterized membrane protein HdeD (DUF308 family)
MTDRTTTLAVRRTPWDVILGLLIIVGGLVLLGNVVFATAVSVLFLGWTALLSGLVLVVGALFRIKSGGFWSAALGGAILVVVGLFMLRNPLIGALSLTLMAGAMFLASGLTRVMVAFQSAQGRWLIMLSGAISIGLGLWVLLNIATATLTLLGTLVGIQTLLEGVTLILVGRLRPPMAS